MSERDLPAELAEMEAELHKALAGGPGVSLRGRVLAAMRAEIRAERRAPSRGVSLSFLVGTAAAALLWINLSMSLVNNTWQVAAAPAAPAPADDSVEQLAERMRISIPELTAQEARRQAATALARSLLAPAGAVPVPVYSSHARNEPWDTH